MKNKTPNEKLAEAVALLRSVEENWNEAALEVYPSELPSFDDLCAMIGEIKFKEEPVASPPGFPPGFWMRDERNRYEAPENSTVGEI